MAQPLNTRGKRKIKMGKYQLDDKGKAQVRRFHEKHSKGGQGKKERLASLRQQFLAKQGEIHGLKKTD